MRHIGAGTAVNSARRCDTSVNAGRAAGSSMVQSSISAVYSGVVCSRSAGQMIGRRPCSSLKSQYRHNNAERTPVSARSVELRGGDRATRHCDDGVGGGERSQWGQSDVEVIVRRSERSPKLEMGLGLDVVLPGYPPCRELPPAAPNWAQHRIARFKSASDTHAGGPWDPREA